MDHLYHGELLNNQRVIIITIIITIIIVINSFGEGLLFTMIWGWFTIHYDLGMVYYYFIIIHNYPTPHLATCPGLKTTELRQKPIQVLTCWDLSSGAGESEI